MMFQIWMLRVAGWLMDNVMRFAFQSPLHTMAATAIAILLIYILVVLVIQLFVAISGLASALQDIVLPKTP